MSKTATYTPNVTVVGDGYNMNETQSFTNLNAPPPGAQQLALGANTVTFPVGYTITGVKLVPSQGNTATLQLTGASWFLHPTDETCLTFAAGTTSFGLTAGGSVNLGLVWF